MSGGDIISESRGAIISETRGDFIGIGTRDNDPHEEHDFGAFAWKGVRYFWKIDYYDRTMTMGSPDAANPSLTVRVLTIMRADEY